MPDQVLRLIYPESLITVPVINQLIRRFDITLNIVRAQISDQDHWLEVQLAGHPAVVAQAIEWLESQGIEIEATRTE